MKTKGVFTVMATVAMSLFFWTSCTAAAEKIGFVNFKEIAVNSEVGKKFFTGLKKDAEKADVKAKARQKELMALNDEIKSRGAATRPEVLRGKRSSLEKKARDYELMLKDIRDDFGKREQEFISKIEPHAIKIIRTIGEREKFTVLLEPSIMMIPYYDRERDITKKVLDEFNRTYKE